MIMIETIKLGGLTLEFLETKDTTENRIDMFRMTVQPKARVPLPHYHETWDEVVYGLSGTLNFSLGDKTVALGPGDSIFIKRGVVHGFTNDSEEPGTCLCVLTPGVIGSAYFRELADLMAGGAPDPARVKEIMLRYGLVPVPPKAA
jgi:quercetin dioxygenase-like cupin family protein